jgi:hypothetical protein
MCSPFIWLRTDYFRARSELYLRLSTSTSDRAAACLRRQAQALRSHPRGSQQGQVSVRTQRFILRLAGYKILVGTGPSSRR